MSSPVIRFLGILTLAFSMARSSPPVLADVISQDVFGLHFHGMAHGRQWPAGVNFGYLRLWDSKVLWRDLEPVRDEWNFALLDRYVEEASKRGVKVLITLGQTPPWAAERPAAHSPYGDGASSEPRSTADWRKYVGTLARRYKGRIGAYEVWNEVNVKHFWSGEFARLVELEKIAAEAIKAEDPAALLVSASVQGGAFREFEAYLKAGGGKFADAVGYHFYAPTEAPEVLPERIRRVREIMARYGLSEKPLWNTEFGWLIPNRDGGLGQNPRPAWNSWRKPGRLEAAGFVLRAYLHALDGGIRHNFWYAWDNGAMGLAEDKGLTPKPAAQGYKRAREWLMGADFRGCSAEDGVWRCTLNREGRAQWIVWSEAVRDFSPPGAWAARTVQGLFDLAPTLVPAGAATRIGPLPALYSQ